MHGKYEVVERESVGTMKDRKSGNPRNKHNSVRAVGGEDFNVFVAPDLLCMSALHASATP